jgi:hypothetical protein
VFAPKPEACSPAGASAPRVDRRVEESRCTDTTSNESVPSARFVEHADTTRPRRVARAVIVLGVALVALAVLAAAIVIRRASPASVHTALPASTSPTGINSLEGSADEDPAIDSVLTEQGLEDATSR